MKNRFFNSNQENKTKFIRETLTKQKLRFNTKWFYKKKDFDFSERKISSKIWFKN